MPGDRCFHLSLSARPAAVAGSLWSLLGFGYASALAPWATGFIVLNERCLSVATHGAGWTVGQRSASHHCSRYRIRLDIPASNSISGTPRPFESRSFRRTNCYTTLFWSRMKFPTFPSLRRGAVAGNRSSTRCGPRDRTLSKRDLLFPRQVWTSLERGENVVKSPKFPPATIDNTKAARAFSGDFINGEIPGDIDQRFG